MVYFSATFTTLTCHQTFRLQDSGGFSAPSYFPRHVRPSLYATLLFTLGFAAILPYGLKKGGTQAHSCFPVKLLFVCEFMLALFL
jgi:hypothetical protein